MTTFTPCHAYFYLKFNAACADALDPYEPPVFSANGGRLQWCVTVRPRDDPIDDDRLKEFCLPTDAEGSPVDLDDLTGRLVEIGPGFGVSVLYHIDLMSMWELKAFHYFLFTFSGIGVMETVHSDTALFKQGGVMGRRSSVPGSWLYVPGFETWEQYKDGHAEENLAAGRLDTGVIIMLQPLSFNLVYPLTSLANPWSPGGYEALDLREVGVTYKLMELGEHRDGTNFLRDDECFFSQANFLMTTKNFKDTYDLNAEAEIFAVLKIPHKCRGLYVHLINMVFGNVKRLTEDPNEIMGMARQMVTKAFSPRTS